MPSLASSVPTFHPLASPLVPPHCCFPFSKTLLPGEKRGETLDSQIIESNSGPQFLSPSLDHPLPLPRTETKIPGVFVLIVNGRPHFDRISDMHLWAPSWRRHRALPIIVSPPLVFGRVSIENGTRLIPRPSPANAIIPTACLSPSLRARRPPAAGNVNRVTDAHVRARARTRAEGTVRPCLLYRYRASLSPGRHRIPTATISLEGFAAGTIYVSPSLSVTRISRLYSSFCISPSLLES